MSEADQDIIIGRITRKIITRLVIPVLIIILGQGSIIYLSQKHKANKEYVEDHYSELYRLTAELATTQAEYMKANDKEKERLWNRIDYIIERMDDYTLKEVKRGPTSQLDSSNKKYGLDFTPNL